MLRRISVVTTVLVLVCGQARAFHQITPTLVQITPASGAGTITSQQWAGIRYVLFDADADLLDDGTTGRQIYLFDLLERDLDHSLGLIRLTTGAGNPQRATTGKLANVVVYDAQSGGTGPRQLFVFDRRRGDRYALTQGSADSVNAHMDNSSRVVVFESSADFFGTGPAGTQIYEIDLRRIAPSCPFPCAATSNAGLTQITHGDGDSRNPVTSTSGKLLAFESDADLAGTGEQATQVYSYDGKTGSLRALGHGPGASRRPSMSLNGGWIAFESDTDLLGNGTMGTQIFAWKRNQSAPRQISDRPIGHSHAPSMSANGHALTFVSSDDLLSSGSTGPEAFSYDLHRGSLIQITDGQNVVSTAAYAEGVFVTFLSDGDLLSNGTSAVALYLTNLFALGADTIP